MSDTRASELQYFPISMFATVMGIGGLGLISEQMILLGEYAHYIHRLLSYIAFTVYLLILLTYTLKSWKYPQAVLDEWSHPIKNSFFPAASISLMLLGTTFIDIHPDLSFFLWSTGCFFQLFLSLSIIRNWISPNPYEVTHSTPAWFIPAVGNIIVPLVGVQHANIELSWFFFSWGLLFWVILLVLIMNRLMFHHPIPQKLLPTLFILLAPPSVGFVAYLKLAGQMDMFARFLFYSAVLFFLLLLSQIQRLAQGRFTLSWWAYTFPLASFSGATQLMGVQTNLLFFSYISYGLYFITFLTVSALSFLTIKGFVKHQVCVPD